MEGNRAEAFAQGEGHRGVCKVPSVKRQTKRMREF